MYSKYHCVSFGVFVICMVLGVFLLSYVEQNPISEIYISDNRPPSQDVFREIRDSSETSLLEGPVLESENVEETRIKRLKTLRENCMKLGYNLTSHDGADISRKILRYMLIDPDHNLTLNSVPKTGSTTWRFVLLNNSETAKVPSDGHLAHGQKLSVIHTKNPFSRSHVKYAGELSKELLLKSLVSYLNVLTVRHPFDRLESTFVDKILLHNMQNLRQVFLQRRNITSEEVEYLATNGSNVKFEEFLQHAITHNEPHWTSIAERTLPCNIPYSYIAKSDSISRDLNYIIHHKLAGHGNAIQLNAMRSTVDNKKGRFLPLFSKIANQSYWISKVLETYREDMELFGYSYFVDGQDVYATCKEYDSSGVCV